MVDSDILQKYKLEGASGYRLVYDTQDKDDPFGDVLIQSPNELGSEMMISLPGEVMIGSAMEDNLKDVFSSYGGDEMEISIGSYVESSSASDSIYGNMPEMPDEDEEDEAEETETPAKKEEEEEKALYNVE